MKVRNGYVSNSSSSSYIIKYKKESSVTIGSEVFTIDDFIYMLDKGRHGYYDTYIVALNKEEYRDIIVTNTYYTDEEKQEILSVLDIFNEDEELLRFEIDYDDRICNKFMKVLKSMNFLTIVEKDGRSCV